MNREPLVEDIVRLIYDRIRAAGNDHVWIHLVPEEAALTRARELGAWSPDQPLFGVPFAVKDNIDMEGLPTTAEIVQPTLTCRGELQAPFRRL